MLACSTLCDPYLNLFRGLIPPLGGTLDLSPILAFVVLDVRTCCCLVCISALSWHPPCPAPCRRARLPQWLFCMIGHRLRRRLPWLL